jgi:hypothetical protein
VLVNDTVKRPVAPSVTLAGPAIDSVVVSMVSVTVVEAAAGLMVTASKPPPAVLLIVADTLPASMYGSSPGASTVAVPLVAPAAMAIVAPLDSVTVIGVTAAWSSVAV